MSDYIHGCAIQPPDYTEPETAEVAPITEKHCHELAEHVMFYGVSTEELEALTEEQYLYLCATGVI